MNIGPGNGFGAVRQQAITWANVNPNYVPYGVTRLQWVKQ